MRAIAVLARCFRRRNFCSSACHRFFPPCVSITVIYALGLVRACFLFHEQDFLNANAQFDVGPMGSKVLQNCLAYKLCYYRFGELRVSQTTLMYVSKVCEACS